MDAIVVISPDGALEKAVVVSDSYRGDRALDAVVERIREANDQLDLDRRVIAVVRVSDETDVIRFLRGDSD